MAQTLLVHTNFSFHPPKAAASIHGKSTKLQWTKKKNPPLMDQNQTCRLIKASTCNNWCSEQMIIMIFIEYPTPQSHKILPRFHNYRTSKIPTNIFMSISLTVVYIYIYASNVCPIKFSVRSNRTNISPLIEVWREWWILAWRLALSLCLCSCWFLKLWLRKVMRQECVGGLRYGRRRRAWPPAWVRPEMPGLSRRQYAAQNSVL